jgi:hypothetical protein
MTNDKYLEQMRKIENALSNIGSGKMAPGEVRREGARGYVVRSVHETTGSRREPAPECAGKRLGRAG